MLISLLISLLLLLFLSVLLFSLLSLLLYYYHYYYFYVFQLTEMHYQITTACGLTGRMWFAVSDVKIRTLFVIGVCRVGLVGGLWLARGGGAYCVVFGSVIQSYRLAYLVVFVWGFATWGCYFWLALGVVWGFATWGCCFWFAFGGGACVVVSRTGIQSCGSCSVLIGTCGVCMAIRPFFMVPRRFLSVLSSYRPPIQIWVPTWIDEILIYLIQSFFNSNFRLEAKK